VRVGEKLAAAIVTKAAEVTGELPKRYTGERRANVDVPGDRGIKLDLSRLGETHEQRRREEFRDAADSKLRRGRRRRSLRHVREPNRVPPDDRIADRRRHREPRKPLRHGEGIDEARGVCRGRRGQRGRVGKERRRPAGGQRDGG